MLFSRHKIAAQRQRPELSNELAFPPYFFTIGGI